MLRDLLAFPAAGRASRLAGLALVALLALAGCREQPAADVSDIPHTPIPKTDAHLQVANNNGAVRFQGTVADAATRDALARDLASVYGSTASGEIGLDQHTNPPPWAENLRALLAAFRLPGAVLEFRGKRIELSGAVSDEDRANLLRVVRRLYPGYELGGLLEGVDMKYALPDTGDAEALVAFLNAIPIAFQTDSGMVTPASLDGFNRAARALKAAGPDVQVQVGVRAEKSDMPEYDLQIAAQRADAVRLQLAIRGVNPGMIQPIVLPAGSGKGGAVEFSATGTAARTAAASANQPAAAPGQAGQKPETPPVN
jgi:outer membrane protein OmpA-like peptidoglycan-associated protein